jgi:hypothetical protein
MSLTSTVIEQTTLFDVAWQQYQNLRANCAAGSKRVCKCFDNLSKLRCRYRGEDAALATALRSWFSLMACFLKLCHSLRLGKIN